MVGRKLVGYIRVSSKGQEDNTSLAEQRKRIEAYCALNDDQLVAVYEEVKSGTKMSTRPQFLEAIRRVQASADGIIAMKLDRIARNTKDLLTLVEDVLEPAGKVLVLLDLNIDTSTPMGSTMLGMMGLIAQMEAKTIKERCTTGQKAKAANGGYAYGSPAFGRQALDKDLVVNEAEQQVIDLIRRHHKSGKTSYGIAKYLNDKAIPTKRGSTWTPTGVNNILKRLYPAVAK